MSYPLMISLIIEHMIGLTDAVFLGRVGDRVMNHLTE